MREDHDRFSRWCKLLGWDESKGSLPGVWDKGGKPITDTCLWTCRWATRFGVLTPDMLKPVQKLSDEEHLAELSDFSAQGSLLASQAIVAKLRGNDWKPLAMKASGQGRKVAPEYLCWFDPEDNIDADRIFVRSYRPGWKPPEPPPPPKPEVLPPPDPRTIKPPQPKKPPHPATFRARDQVTAMQMSLFQERMETYAKEIENWQADFMTWKKFMEEEGPRIKRKEAYEKKKVEKARMKAEAEKVPE